MENQNIALIKKVLESAPRTIIKHPERVSSEKPDHIVIDKSGGVANGMTMVDAAKMVDGVHLDVYDYFNISINDVDKPTLNRLGYIMKWMFASEPSLDLGLRHINRIMIKLGNWSTGKTKLDMIYNYLRLNEYTPSNKA